MDLRPYSIEPVPGPKTITIKQDYRISLCFRDPATGAVILDCTGENSVLMSDLLENLPSGKLAVFAGDNAPRMVALHAGLADG